MTSHRAPLNFLGDDATSSSEKPTYVASSEGEQDPEKKGHSQDVVVTEGETSESYSAWELKGEA